MYLVQAKHQSQHIAVFSACLPLSKSDPNFSVLSPCRDQCYISKGYDATSHFETEINDVLSMYQRITGAVPRKECLLLRCTALLWPLPTCCAAVLCCLCCI